MNKEELIALGERKLDALCEMCGEDTVIFTNPDYASALIGFSDDYRAIYSYSKMIEHLMIVDGMDEEEAADFVSYNTCRASSYMGGNAPIVMYDLIDF